jgi:hypothetical protein
MGYLRTEVNAYSDANIRKNANDANKKSFGKLRI